MAYRLFNFVFKKSFLILGCIFTLAHTHHAKAQILDDSTKQVYSVKTSKYVLEEDFLNGNYYNQSSDTNAHRMRGLHMPDSTINNLHQYNHIYKNHTLNQDLGTYLSPTQNVYYQSPESIGKQYGFNSLDAYAIPHQKVKFFDTKSPYSQLSYVQGRRGQQALNVELSRNIFKNWNVGFELRRHTSRRIIASSTGTGGGVKPLESSDYIFCATTRFFSNNHRYQLLAYLNHAHQIFFNNGGIKPTALDSVVSENFKYELAQSYFTNARTIDKRVNYHLFQEYALGHNKNIQVYSIHDYKKRANRFTHNLVNAGSNNRSFKSDTLLYNVSPIYLEEYGTNSKKQQFRYSTLYMDDRTDFYEFENQFGIKAQVKTIKFRTYLRRRDFTYAQLNYDRDTIPFNADSIILKSETNMLLGKSQRFSENFVGIALDLSPSKWANLKLRGEYMPTRDYMYQLEFYNPYLSLSYKSIFYSPSLFQLFHNSNLRTFSWSNLKNNNESNLNNTKADKLQVSLNFTNKNFTFRPSFSYEQINQLIYLDTLARPAQTNTNLNFVSSDLFLAARLWKFHLESYTKYTIQNVDSFLIAPRLYNHSRIYYQNGIFKKAANIQLGIDSYWRDAYYGAAYMPITQQFYNNYTFLLSQFLQFDIFLNIQIKNAAVFFKYAYINQAGKGYFITPGYTAMPASFDFGIRWMFFD